jgi:hypothetical protein
MNKLKMPDLLVEDAVYPDPRYENGGEDTWLKAQPV